MGTRVQKTELSFDTSEQVVHKGLNRNTETNARRCHIAGIVLDPPSGYEYCGAAARSNNQQESHAVAAVVYGRFVNRRTI